MGLQHQVLVKEWINNTESWWVGNTEETDMEIRDLWNKLHIDRNLMISVRIWVGNMRQQRN